MNDLDAQLADTEARLADVRRRQANNEALGFACAVLFVFAVAAVFITTVSAMGGAFVLFAGILAAASSWAIR